MMIVKPRPHYVGTACAAASTTTNRMFLSWDPASLLLRETARPRQAAGAEQAGQLNQLSLKVGTP
jgi:hypothetical protein